MKGNESCKGIFAKEGPFERACGAFPMVESQRAMSVLFGCFFQCGVLTIDKILIYTIYSNSSNLNLEYMCILFSVVFCDTAMLFEALVILVL